MVFSINKNECIHKLIIFKIKICIINLPLCPMRSRNPTDNLHQPQVHAGPGWLHRSPFCHADIILRSPSLILCIHYFIRIIVGKEWTLFWNQNWVIQTSKFETFTAIVSIFLIYDYHIWGINLLSINLSLKIS